MKQIYVWLLVCAALSPQIVDAESLVSPAGYENVAGPLNNSLPFHSNPVQQDTVRYQQIYGATDLAQMTGKLVTAIAFRVDERDGFDGDYAGGFVYSSLNVQLSITSLGVDQLTPDLDGNVGPNPQTVYNATYHVPSLEGDLPVNPFDFVITFQSPFLYTGGNVLVDIRTPGGATPLPYLDAVSAPDSVSRMYTWPLINGNQGDTLGLVTQFQFVPEPGGILLAVPAMLALLLYGSRRR